MPAAEAAASAALRPSAEIAAVRAHEREGGRPTTWPVNDTLPPDVSR